MSALSDDFARFNLDPHAVREWEDGTRIDGSSRAYECWYFDAHLTEGTKVVVVHHWGDVGLKKVVNDWYRARGQAGPYVVVASVITGAEKHGLVEIPFFMLASEGRIVGGDTAKMTFERRYVFTDSKTGKPVANILRFTFVDGENRYVVTFERERDLARTWLAKELPWPKRAAARLTGFDGAYLRFAGVLTVEHYEAGRLIDKYTDDAAWDLLYLGHAPA